MNTYACRMLEDITCAICPCAVLLVLLLQTGVRCLHLWRLHLGNPRAALLTYQKTKQSFLLFNILRCTKIAFIPTSTRYYYSHCMCKKNHEGAHEWARQQQMLAWTPAFSEGGGGGPHSESGKCPSEQDSTTDWWLLQDRSTLNCLIRTHKKACSLYKNPSFQYQHC